MKICRPRDKNTLTKRWTGAGESDRIGKEKEDGMTKMIVGDEMKKDYTEEELEFAIFCVESVAETLGVDALAVYDAYTRETNLLDDYIIPCYDILHTQGKEYIANDLIDRMREKGVAI